MYSRFSAKFSTREKRHLCILIKLYNQASVSVSTRTFLFLYLFLSLLTGLLSVFFQLTSFCFGCVSIVPERLTNTPDVFVPFLFLFLLFLFSFCSIFVLVSPLSYVSVSTDGLLGLILIQ